MGRPPENSIVIFCDGACSGNPGPGGWGAIVLSPDGQVRELGGRSPRTTNNQMELTGAIEALKAIEQMPGEAYVFTDSLYVLKGITQWIWGWRRRGWISSSGGEVLNRDLWERLFALTTPRKKPNGLHWGYVRGHADIPGNDRVDAIAVAYSKGIPLPLYEGPLSLYDVDLLRIPDEDKPAPAKSNGGGSKSKAYSYVSLVGKAAARHASWAECERRVKGQSGAKFKKTASAAEEEAILREWGVDPKSLG